MKVAPPSLVAFFVSHNRPAKIIAGANCIREKHSCPRVLFKPIRALVILHSLWDPAPSSSGINLGKRALEGETP